MSGDDRDAEDGEMIVRMRMERDDGDAKDVRFDRDAEVMRDE